jgi:hypothetical protein
MQQVFLLWYAREIGQSKRELLIGVYGTEAEAKAAIERARNKQGFVDHPDGFEICPYALNRDHWTEGFVLAE